MLTQPEATLAAGLAAAIGALVSAVVAYLAIWQGSVNTRRALEAQAEAARAERVFPDLRRVYLQILTEVTRVQLERARQEARAKAGTAPIAWGPLEGGPEDLQLHISAFGSSPVRQCWREAVMADHEAAGAATALAEELEETYGSTRYGAAVLAPGDEASRKLGAAWSEYERLLCRALDADGQLVSLIRRELGSDIGEAR